MAGGGGRDTSAESEFDDVLGELRGPEATRGLDRLFSVLPSLLRVANPDGPSAGEVADEWMNSPRESNFARYFEEKDVPEGLAGLLGFGAELVEPGPGEIGQAARFLPQAAPFLASALPRPLLERMAQFTRAVGPDGLPVRTRHGTNAAYDRHDPSAWAPGAWFGRAHYSTEGMPQGQYRDLLGPVYHDPNEPDVLDALTSNYIYPGAEGNVRLEYLDMRNPLDYEARADDPMALIDRLIAESISDPAKQAEARTRAGQVLQVFDKARGSIPGHPSHTTMGDALLAAQSGMSGNGPSLLNGRLGSAPYAARAAFRSGYDGIIGRSYDPFGSVGYTGPLVYATPQRDQIIPAGNIPAALVGMKNRGMIDTSEPGIQELFDLYDSPPALDEWRVREDEVLRMLRSSLS